MLKELYEAIGVQAMAAAKPKEFHPDAEPGHVYYLLSPDRGLERKEAAPAVREHQAMSLESFMSSLEELPGGDGKKVVWFSRAGVTGYLDDSTRRDWVGFKMEYSPQVLSLIDLERKAPWFGQVDFVRLLKVTFAGCQGPSGNLLDVCKKIRFKTSTSGQSDVGQGKVSLGRTLEAQLTGSADLPDYVRLEVPVFAQGSLAAITETVDCGLEVNAETEKFQLVPLPGQIERAVTNAEMRIGATLINLVSEDNVQVFYGVA